MSDKNKRIPTAAEISQRLDRVAEQQEKSTARLDRIDAMLEKIAAQQAKNSRLIARNSRQIGGVERIFGDMAEYVSYTNLKGLLAMQAGIAISGVDKRCKHEYAGRNYEFDLIASGNGLVVAIEVKTTLRSGDVDNFASIMQDFSAIFPAYAPWDIYGGFAYMKAHDGTEELAHKHGLLTIRAIGSAAQLVGFEKDKLRNFRITDR